MTNRDNITKEQLISIIKENQDQTSEYIGKLLAVYKFNKSFWNSHDYYKFNSNDERFRLVNSVGSWGEYYYCISNYGRVIVLNTKSPKDFDNKEFYLTDKINYFIIQITKKGYMTNINSQLPKGVKVAKEKEIYELIRDSGWLKKDKSEDIAKKLLKKRLHEIKNNRLEIHHINNKPNDNRIENLIYLPKSIHNYAH